MHSLRLRRTIALVSDSLSTRIERFWNHPRLAELYPEFLFAAHGVICASTPLLDAAADEAALRPESDELARRLAPYLREHAEEEDGHDRWLLEDLERCCIARERVLERIPYPSAAALAGAQHFWLRHVHPVAILGYLAVLENPASPAFLDQVAERSGLPPASMSAHMRHARLDVAHVAEFDAMLDALPLTQHHVNIITTSAITAVAHLDAFFADVLEHFSRIEDETLAHTIFTRMRSPKPIPLGASEAASRPVM